MSSLMYIRMKANDCPGIAFVRSGCTISFISESFARNANLLDNIDRSDRQKIFVVPSGGVKVLGWVNNVQVRIDELNLQFVYRFGVMSDKHLALYCPKKFDMLLANELLYALELGTDHGNKTVWLRKVAKCLTEEEIEREMENTN